MLGAVELLATIMETVNTDLPPNALADFQAGIFKTAIHKDVRTNLNACFVQDSDTAASFDALMKDIEAKDYRRVRTAAEGLFSNMKKCLDPCEMDDDVQIALNM